MAADWTIGGNEILGFEVGSHDTLSWSASDHLKVHGNELPPYEGSYEAVPSWSQQTFATEGRTMESDFLVDGIISLEVANDSGGLTLTI